MCPSAWPDPRQAPVGVFDSGIGGLSVLRHIRAALPHEHLLYLADAGFVPYGTKSDQEVMQRTRAATAFLRGHGIKALVVACNTATASAIHVLRQDHPDLPVIGVEPGLKPAAAGSRNGVIGVMATERTLASEKFLALKQRVEEGGQLRFVLQACNGLVDQIEKGELASAATRQLVDRYVYPLLAQDADTLVLGCTHYPFVQALIEDACARAGHAVTIVDTGLAVARQLERVLQQQDLLRPASANDAADGTGDGASQPAIHAYTSGSRGSLETAFSRLLGLEIPVHGVAQHT